MDENPYRSPENHEGSHQGYLKALRTMAGIALAVLAAPFVVAALLGFGLLPYEREWLLFWFASGSAGIATVLLYAGNKLTRE